MQKKLLDPEWPVTLLYQSARFTVVKATAMVGKNKDIPIEAEGISRCSDLDFPSLALGLEIAKGRALKALTCKLQHHPIRHHYMG